MNVPAATHEIDGSTTARTADDRRGDRARYALVACWIVVLAMLPFAGEKTADWSDVRDLVRAGEVTEVQVNGELPAGSSGFSTVDVHWRHGVLRYVTNVRQVQGDNPDGATSVDDDDPITVLRSAPSDRLAALDPGLQISRGAHGFHVDKFLGFEVPTFLAFVPVVLMLLGLGVLIVGPQPWRATPWAWFWWLWNPIGVAGFLLLSGPFPGIPAPRDPARRLTGGWSFLLMLVVTSMSFTILGMTVEL